MLKSVVMSELLQPYLPEFSPEVVKYKGSEFLTATKEYGDYHIELTPEGIQKASTRQNPFGLPSTEYESISTIIQSDEAKKELLEIRGTRDASVLWNGHGYQDFVFHRDEFGPVVLIFAPRLYDLLDNSLPYLMTRYDNHSDKIWIQKQQGLE